MIFNSFNMCYRYSDPVYLKIKKLTVLTKLVTESNGKQILDELRCVVCFAVRRGMVWYGVWYRVWYGVWYGMVYSVWYGMVWYGMVWYGMVWYGMVWYGMVWYGMVWYGMVWYGIIG